MTQATETPVDSEPGSHEVSGKDTQAPGFRTAYERYMLIPALGGNAIFYIQAAKAFATESAADLSIMAFSVSVWALTSWLVYGFVLRNRILIWANIVGVFGAILVLVTIALYGSP